jgi:hypothetical protein
VPQREIVAAYRAAYRVAYRAEYRAAKRACRTLLTLVRSLFHYHLCRRPLRLREKERERV